MEEENVSSFIYVMHIKNLQRREKISKCIPLMFNIQYILKRGRPHMCSYDGEVIKSIVKREYDKLFSLS